jgi:hypothetical protein
VVKHAHPDYKGDKLEVVYGVKSMSLRSYWDGPSRSYFAVVRLADGAAKDAPDSHPFFDAKYEGVDDFVIPAGFVVVERRYFGQSQYITVHVPGEAPLLVAPSSEPLTDDEKLVLIATAALKSSYAGISDYRAKELQERGLSMARITAARESLKAKKLLNKAGAITPDGRNAIEGDARRWTF